MPEIGFESPGDPSTVHVVLPPRYGVTIPDELLIADAAGGAYLLYQGVVCIYPADPEAPEPCGHRVLVPRTLRQDFGGDVLDVYAGLLGAEVMEAMDRFLADGQPDKVIVSLSVFDPIFEAIIMEVHDQSAAQRSQTPHDRKVPDSSQLEGDMTNITQEATHRVVLDRLTNEHMVDVVIPRLTPVRIPERVFSTGPHGEVWYDYRQMIVVDCGDDSLPVSEYRVLVPAGLTYSGPDVRSACATLLGPELYAAVCQYLDGHGPNVIDVSLAVLQRFVQVMEIDAGLG